MERVKIFFAAWAILCALLLVFFGLVSGVVFFAAWMIPDFFPWGPVRGIIAGSALVALVISVCGEAA